MFSIDTVRIYKTDVGDRSVAAEDLDSAASYFGLVPLQVYDTGKVVYLDKLTIGEYNLFLREGAAPCQKIGVLG